MAPGGKQDPQWRQRFYTPTTSDAAVLCYHRWLQDVGGAVQWGRPPDHLVEPKGREELVERFQSHTQHCESCSQALSVSRDVLRLGQALVILGLLTSSLIEELKWPSAILAILAAIVVALAAELEKQLTVGEYPPPRNQ